MSCACTCVARVNFGVLPVHCRLILPVPLVSPSRLLLDIGSCVCGQIKSNRIDCGWSHFLPQKQKYVKNKNMCYSTSEGDQMPKKKKAAAGRSANFFDVLPLDNGGEPPSVSKKRGSNKRGKNKKGDGVPETERKDAGSSLTGFDMDAAVGRAAGSADEDMEGVDDGADDVDASEPFVRDLRLLTIVKTPGGLSAQSWVVLTTLWRSANRAISAVRDVLSGLISPTGYAAIAEGKRLAGRLTADGDEVVFCQTGLVEGEHGCDLKPIFPPDSLEQGAQKPSLSGVLIIIGTYPGTMRALPKIPSLLSLFVM